MKIKRINAENLRLILEMATDVEWHVEVLPNLPNPEILINKTDDIENYYLTEFTEQEIEEIRKICKECNWSYTIGVDKGNMVSYIRFNEK